MDSKVCSKCKIEKVLSEFSKHCAEKDGLRSQCKECVAEYDKQYRAENREAILGYKKKYYAENKEVVLLKKKKYRAENKETMLSRDKQYYTENKETISLKKKKYRAENKDIFRKNGSKRRARKLQAMPKWLDSDQKKWIAWIYKQARRIEQYTGIKQHVDHIMPLQGKTMSGLHVPWNLQILPAEENLRKSNKIDYKIGNSPPVVII